MNRDTGKTVRILIAGGGTGGHVFPALAIREALARCDPRVEVIFVGTRRGLEAEVIPRHNGRLYTLWISGFARGALWRNLLLPVKLMVSFVQSAGLLLSFRPHVVVGTGGYVMGPVLWTAQRLGIPTVLQEQNSRPGFTTRRLARKANIVCAGFEAVRGSLPCARVEVTGNPLRTEFSGAPPLNTEGRWNLDHSRCTVFVFGGSAGARTINEAVAEALPALLERYNVIWQTGRAGVPAGANRQAVDMGLRSGNLSVHPFIHDMRGAYSVANLAVCRAGAMTLAELAAAGVPAVLVPYPHAADDHQTANAQAVVDKGAAVLVTDSELTGRRLIEVVNSCLESEENRTAMARNMKSLARPDAADRIAEIVLSLVSHR